MRNAFAEALSELADADPRVVLLSADIGNRLFDKFKAAHPERFYNCGVAEANMMGVAAGLAMGGYRPFCYTITPFITYRCLEQIRVDTCYHDQPVVIVGTGSGFSYASLGATHHSCEDLAVLRVLPGMTVMAPADAWEVRAVLRASLGSHGPVYVRIGKKGEPRVHQGEPQLRIGENIILRAGADVCLMCAGTITSVGVEAAEMLVVAGHQPEVVSCHTVKPLDTAYLQRVFAAFRLVVTIEEHSILGGFGSAVAEWLADHPGMHGRLLRLGTGDAFLHETCNQEEAREHFGLTAAGVAGTIEKILAAPWSDAPATGYAHWRGF